MGHVPKAGRPATGTGQAGTLAHGQKQWLEIGMLLVQNARVLHSTNRWLA